MLGKLLGYSKEQAQADTKSISVIKDPFAVDKIRSININYYKSSYTNSWSAVVRFSNGNTEGSQHTGDCQEFDEVMTKLKVIIEAVNK